MTSALGQLDHWDVPHAAAAVIHGERGVVACRGDDRAFPWASVTKLATAYATLVAVEEGSIGLDDPAGPPSSTVRHLLAHASGLPFEGTEPQAAPGQKRIYSNAGFEALAAAVAAATGMAFDTYLDEAVLEPLGMGARLRADRSPAAGMAGTINDLATLAAELLRPSLVDPATRRQAATVQFPGLRGIVPGYGAYDPCDWGLGFELKGGKEPHWTAPANSPATFGHFGARGGFLWVDPAADLALVVLTDRDFGPWAVAAWPPLAGAVLAEWAERPIG